MLKSASKLNIYVHVHVCRVLLQHNTCTLYTVNTAFLNNAPVHSHFSCLCIEEPWEKFMSDYSERHPNLIDQAATEAALGSMAPSSPAESAKRSRSTSVEAPSTQAKKPKYDNSTLLHTYTACTVPTV